MKPKLIFSILPIILLASCTSHKPTSMPGSDRDQYGCIPSAGYSWCLSTNQCERPWELAKKQGFTLNQDSFDQYCNNPSR